ncbi:MAG: hypothetical protein AB2733_17735 [Candidatus Thiodiazotropha taylori]|nr:hypothetical protein [Candidatus Thiodiazotropha taylori]MCG8087324.1 hypothetical protein [Candidatus Thiodiazotropha taylori]
MVRRQLVADDASADQENAEQPGEAHRFYEISGDRLVFKYKDITSLNIEYYKIIENSD